jgi:hypothetical protein
MEVIMQFLEKSNIDSRILFILNAVNRITKKNVRYIFSNYRVEPVIDE